MKIDRAVRNNLRQLAAAADQYFLENGVTTVKLEQLVGNADHYLLRELKPVDGEDYSELKLSQGVAATTGWAITTARGVEVRYQQP